MARNAKTAATLLFVLLATAGCFSSHPANPTPSPSPPSGQNVGGLHPELAEDVKNELLLAYRNYERLAGDHDEILPVSGTGSDFFAKGHPIGLSRIEVLDTLYLMGADEDLRNAVNLTAKVSFDIDAPFQVFETIIRVVGGLLSGYHATHDARLLNQTVDLANRLMPAFEKSPTGMPYRYVNLHTGAVTGAVNVLAEIGTNVAEFGSLSRTTGDPRYEAAAKKALKAVYDRRSSKDLVGTAINIETGQWTPELPIGVANVIPGGNPGAVQSTINPPVDSFFEYLWDGWDLLGDKDYLTWYNVLTDGILRQQSVIIPGASTPQSANGIDGKVCQCQWFSTNEYQTGVTTDTGQSELAAFYAGLLAQSGHVALGAAYHDSWSAAMSYGNYRILPEGLEPAQFTAISKGNDLRPEYVDAALNLWLKTNDTKYVDRAVQYWNNQKATSRVPNGYTTLDDVTTRPEKQGDLTPAYWYSENMKYYYLMFGHPARFDYANNYLSTEGNVFRGLVR